MVFDWNGKKADPGSQSLDKDIQRNSPVQITARESHYHVHAGN